MGFAPELSLGETSQLRRARSKAAQHLLLSARPRCSRGADTRPKFGQYWPTFTHDWPICANFGPT